MTCVIADLLKDWPCTWIQGSFSHPIKGISDDSRRIKKGDVFVAINGRNENGTNYIKDAIRRGAVCVITEEKVPIVAEQEIAYAMVPNTKTFLSHASSRVFGNPSHQLHIIGVTGTNGKTTVSHLIGQLLIAQGLKVAVIGTLGLYIDGHKAKEVPSQLTTWSAPVLHETLSFCLNEKVTHVVLEASSMGLAQHRLDHCQIDQGVLLNIGHDHLEDHLGMADYQKAKLRLITLSKQIVANEDDEFWFSHAKKCIKPVEWFNHKQVAILEMNAHTMKLSIQGESLPKEVAFTGIFNVSNLAAALATVKQMGYPIEKVMPMISSLTLPEGRFQFIEKEYCQVLIDYAHTPEAMQQLLHSAAQIAEGKLILVFGCGGERDREKRREMGEIAAFYAQELWVTSDNPRSENPIDICNEIISELPSSSNIHVVIDRKCAIEQALEHAKPNDIVLIAGKGHEETQQIGSTYFPFSDKNIVREFLDRLTRLSGNYKE